MNKNSLFKKCLLSLILCFVGVLGMSSKNASAMSNEEIYKNALYNAIQQCYTQTGVLRDEIMLGDYPSNEYYTSNGFDSLFLDNDSYKVYVPTMKGILGNNLTVLTDRGSKVTCGDLFRGEEKSWFSNEEGSMTGIMDISGKTGSIPNKNAAKETIESFLDNMGYTRKVTSGDTKSCLTVEYKLNSDYGGFDDWKKVSMICWPTDVLFGDYDDESRWYGDVEANMEIIDMRDSTDKTIVRYGQSECESSTLNPAQECMNCRDYNYACVDGGSLELYVNLVGEVAEVNVGYPIITFQYDDRGNIRNFNKTVLDTVREESDYRLTYSEQTASSSATLSVQMDENTTNAYLRARQFLSGQSEETTFTKQDKYQLYMWYIDNIFNLRGVNSESCVQERPSSAYTDNENIFITLVKTEKATGWCKINIIEEDRSKKVSGFTLNNNKRLDTEYDARGIVGAIWELNLGVEDAIEPTFAGVSGGGIATGDPENPETPTGDVDPCQNNAGSLAWVVCPVMKGIGNALEWAYKGAVEPLLVVNSQEFFNGADSPARQAWSIMVGFANSAMIIFLIVIIFSQLTGVGIDNYGIKKSLPKILVAAVLINLSFILCQVLVEVSNICGQALYNLFSNINIADSVMVNGKNVAISKPEELFTALFYLMCGGLVAFGGLTVYDAVSNGGGVVSALVIPVILALLVAIIAILFFFVIVGLRKAGVVMLVIISPIAVLCYMLPNTKKYFDKWLKAFEGLLFVYPICGLLLGGSQFLAKVILRIGAGSNDFLMYFVGSMLLVVPYFFVPSLIKGSFAAMGNIGAKISNIGRSIGKRGSGRINSAWGNSRRAKYAQDRAAYKKKFNYDKLAYKKAAKRQGEKVTRDQLGSFKTQRAYDDQELMNSYNQGVATAVVGSTAITPEVADSRAKSAKQAKEIKLWKDQYGKYSRAEMSGELAAAAVGGDVSRLLAAFSTAEERGMGKEMLNVLNSDVGKKMVTGTNGKVILDQLSSSKVKAISGYAKTQTKELDKDPKAKAISMDEWIKADKESKNSLAKYAADKGADFLVGMDDDQLGALFANGGGAAITTEMIVKATLATTDAKELGILNEQLKNRDDIEIKGKDLESMSGSTIEAILKNASAKTTESINTAVKDTIAANKQGNVSEAVKNAINNAGHGVIGFNGVTNGAQSTTQQATYTPQGYDGYDDDTSGYD